ncbi:hypothetical protein [uncultured Cyclobacterium sp.]|uniref:hypothetical protein n=1 Tax=uncultured Cyclobacterium sp. TaxID=453820 RepID=UPI0030EC6730
MEKQFKKYLLILRLSFAGALMVFVFLNVFLDVFGLYGFRDKDNVRVYGEERFSKYLMTFNHVPQHFDGMILGPSLSANLNPESIPDKNYFNVSLMGARMNNVLALATNVLENNGTIKEAIVCIHPYVTANTKVEETGFMNLDTYWKAYGSVNLLRVYGLGLIRDFDLWPNKYPKNQYRTNGSNAFEALFKVEDVAGRIAEEVNNVKVNEFEIGSNHRRDFKKLLTLLEQNKIQTFIYFHPVPYPIYQAHSDKMNHYWEDILDGTNVEKSELMSTYNFNSPEFSDFSKDVSNYIDHGHLSLKGQEILIREIKAKMDQVKQ